MTTEFDRNTFLPLYEQVRQFLVSLIESGRLKPGDRLPSEKELENKFGVSRITVRRALQDLANQDKIMRVPGKGSFVLQPKIEPLTALTSFSENMRAQGYEPSYQKSQVSVVLPEPKIASALRLEEGKALHISRLMCADGLPMALQDAYLPHYIYELNPAFFTPEVLNNISMYKILEVELGIKLYRAEEWVDASKARIEEAKLLEINKGESILIVERLTFSTEENPIEYVKLVFPANRYRYKVELFRPSKQRGWNEIERR